MSITPTHHTELGKTLKELAAGLVKAHMTREEAKQKFDTAFLEAVLQAANGNLCKAARRAGVHRNSYARLLPAEKISRIRKDCRWYQKCQPTLRGLRYEDKGQKAQVAA